MAPHINVVRMLISVKLDHTLYSINYGKFIMDI